MWPIVFEGKQDLIELKTIAQQRNNNERDGE